MFSNSMPAAYEAVKMFKESLPSSKILMGGPHPTAMPQDVFDQFEQCDYVLRGESDFSIVELVKSLEKGNSLKDVKGLSYKKDGQVIHNEPAPTIKDLDAISFPARELLDSAYKKHTYWRMGHTGTTDVLISSRGCPFDCNFCFKITREARFRSADNILEELIMLKNRGINNVHVMDDLFVANKTKCIQIMEKIKQNKLNMNFKVRARVDTISRDILLIMKEAGVKAVVYGIESGSQTMLDLMNKRTTVGQNYKAVEMTKKTGLQCYADLFMGFPGETMDTIRETERFIIRSKPTALNFAVMYPLPKTKVYDDAKAQNTLIGKWGIREAAPWIKLPWIKSKKDLFVIRNKIIRKYLLHPVVLFNGLKFLIRDMDLFQIKILFTYFFKEILAGAGNTYLNWKLPRWIRPTRNTS